MLHMPVFVKLRLWLFQEMSSWDALSSTYLGFCHLSNWLKIHHPSGYCINNNTASYNCKYSDYKLIFWCRLSVENKFCLCGKQTSVSMGCCLPPERCWGLSPPIMFSGALRAQTLQEVVAPCMSHLSVQAGDIFPLAKPPLIIMDLVLSKRSRTQTQPGEPTCNWTVV